MALSFAYIKPISSWMLVLSLALYHWQHNYTTTKAYYILSNHGSDMNVEFKSKEGTKFQKLIFHDTVVLVDRYLDVEQWLLQCGTSYFCLWFGSLFLNSLFAWHSHEWLDTYTYTCKFNEQQDSLLVLL